MKTECIAPSKPSRQTTSTETYEKEDSSPDSEQKVVPIEISHILRQHMAYWAAEMYAE